MMFKTHLAFSFFIGFFLVRIIDFSNAFLFLTLVVFFGIFPDIDEKTSKISRKTKLFSWPIRVLFKHRTFFHSIFIAFFLFLLFYFFIDKVAAFGILTGYLSHLFLDSLNYAGVRFFSPFSNFRVKGFLKSGGFFDYFLFLFFLVLDFFIVFCFCA